MAAGYRAVGRDGMAAGLTDRPWTLAELLTEATKSSLS